MPSRYKAAVTRALTRLQADQPNANGAQAAWIAVALSEAADMSRDPRLLPPVAAAALQLAAAQIEIVPGVFAWGDKPARQLDTELSMPCFVALTLAHAHRQAADPRQTGTALVSRIIQSRTDDQCFPKTWSATANEGEAAAAAALVAAITQCDEGIRRRVIIDAQIRLAGEVADNGDVAALSWLTWAHVLMPDATWHGTRPAIMQLANKQIDAGNADDDGMWPGDGKHRYGWTGGTTVTSAWATMALANCCRIDYELAKSAK